MPTARDDTIEALLRGGVAGLLATVPMTLVMRGLFRALPERERYPLPPQQITGRVAAGVGVETHAPPGGGWEAKTHLAHYAYGAACGALYALAAPRLPIASPAARGSIFGVGVWTASYLGWLPAVGILPPATREPARRNGVMMLAHVVWGAAAGTLLARRLK